MQGVDINLVGPRTNANNSASAYYLDRYIYGVLLLASVFGFIGRSYVGHGFSGHGLGTPYDVTCHNRHNTNSWF